MKTAALFGWCAGVWAVTLHAAVPLGDINTTAQAPAYVSLAAVDLANVTLFVFDEGTHGAELWSTDGTPAGTQLVRDINPGPLSSSITSLVVAQGTAFFWADDGTNGVQLWKSDGTARGTVLVANITPTDHAVSGPIAPPLVAVGAVVYFAATDGKAGVELWRSDGTAPGTYLLRDIAPGAADSNPDLLTVLGSRLFFVADDGTHGQELWTSDGSPSGTHMVQDLNPGSPGSSPRQLLVVDQTLYFVAARLPNKLAVWRAASNGSSATAISGLPDTSIPLGLIQVGGGVVFGSLGALYGAGPSGALVNLGNGACSDPDSAPIPSSAITIGSRTLFSIALPADCTFGGPDHTDLWTTDGTAAGTGPLNPGAGIFSVYQIAISAPAANGEVYFWSGSFLPGTITPGGPTGIWRSNGTQAGTQLAVSVPVDSPRIVRLGNRLYFASGENVDPQGSELWSSDGTPGGTQRVLDINPGAANALPDQLTLARGRLLFTADDGAVQRQPWVSDGTAAGTMRLHDTAVSRNTGDSAPTFFATVGGLTLFGANDGVTGQELYATDATPAGTRMVADIAPGAASSNPLYFVNFGATALFEADDGMSGGELWRSDGTTQATLRIADIQPGLGSGAPLAFGTMVLNGVAYFGANDGVNGGQLWRSDGTAAGTYLFQLLAPAPNGTAVDVLTTLNGRGLFAAYVGPTLRLWSTDGTVAGTAPLRLDMEVRNAQDRAVLNGFVYFQGVDANGDAELWRSDGTAAGTTRVRDLNPGGSSNPRGFYASNTMLLFTACTGGTTCTLFASVDPPTAVQALPGFEVNGPVVTDGSRFFFIDATSLPARLVISDGTPAGTRYLQGSLPFSGAINQYTWFAGSLVLSVSDPVLGPSLWASDGSAAGTHLLAAFDPPPSGVYPGAFFTVGSKLLFQGYRQSTGIEPWALDSVTPNAADDRVHTPFNTAARIRVLANDGDLSGHLDASSVDVIAQPAFGAVAVDSSTGDILYTPNAGVSGMDVFQYTVRNLQGHVSNGANVFVTVAAPPGASAGTAPTPPVTPAPPPNTSGGSGGGGGSIELLTLSALACFAVLGRRARRRR